MNHLDKIKSIIATRKRDNETKKSDFFQQIKDLNFDLDAKKLKDLKSLLTKELDDMISKFTSYSQFLQSKKKNPSSSVPYLDSIARNAINLRDAMKPIGKIKINLNLLENIHYCFAKLKKSLMDASKATFPTRIFHSATLSYKPTRGKLRDLFTQLENCEKQFSLVVFEKQIKSLIPKLKKLNLPKISKADNIEADIWYPTKKLGDYKLFTFLTKFEGSDGLLSFGISIERLLEVIEKAEGSSSCEIYKKIKKYKIDQKIECDICGAEQDISEFIVLPCCSHALCKTCVGECIKTDPRCPFCRKSIPKNLK